MIISPAHQSFSVLCFLLATLPYTIAFDRDKCFQTALSLVSNGSIPPTSSFFFRDPVGGTPYDGADNMTLTLEGCNAICGPAQTYYLDIGPRLTVWLLPIILLLANVEFGPLDKHKFMALLHLVGDPVDSMWSLLHKLDTWDRCYRLAERHHGACSSCRLVLASIFAGYEEIQGPRIESEHSFDMLVERYNASTKFNEWRRAAVRLADSRTDELNRTVFAFFLYIFQLICAFVPEVGGAPSSPPGGRIATGVLLSWLVPAILISNIVGSLPSPRTAYDIFADFITRTNGEMLYVSDQHSTFLPGSARLTRNSSAAYLDALAWSGANYMFRPWKAHFITFTRHPHLRTLLLIGLAVTPIMIGLIVGFLVLWYQVPAGLNCRHVWLVSAVIFWCLSTCITSITNSHRIATGKYHWRLVLVKDALVAVPIFTIVCLSAVGLFNFCWCWSGPFQYPGRGRVPLLDTVYFENARSIYPIMVAISLLLQVMLVIAVSTIWWRGLKLLRWSNSKRKEEWNRVFNRSGCGCNLSNVSLEKSSVTGQEVRLLSSRPKTTSWSDAHRSQSYGRWSQGLVNHTTPHSVSIQELTTKSHTR